MCVYIYIYIKQYLSFLFLCISDWKFIYFVCKCKKKNTPNSNKSIVDWNIKQTQKRKKRRYRINITKIFKRLRTFSGFYSFTNKTSKERYCLLAQKYIKTITQIQKNQFTYQKPKNKTRLPNKHLYSKA